jgi:hypothetical protein
MEVLYPTVKNARISQKARKMAERIQLIFRSPC